jgi:hypothetical protein
MMPSGLTSVRHRCTLAHAADGGRQAATQGPPLQVRVQVAGPRQKKMTPCPVPCYGRERGRLPAVTGSERLRVGVFPPLTGADDLMPYNGDCWWLV